MGDGHLREGPAEGEHARMGGGASSRPWILGEAPWVAVFGPSAGHARHDRQPSCWFRVREAVVASFCLAAGRPRGNCWLLHEGDFYGFFWAGCGASHLKSLALVQGMLLLRLLGWQWGVSFAIAGRPA